MAQAETTQATTEQPVEEHGNVFSFSSHMVLLTWIAFLIAAVVLHRLLWRPLMKFIDARETEIKQSLDDAEAARKAAAQADEKAASVLAAADADARAKADAAAIASMKHIAALESDAKDAIAAKRTQAQARLDAEREDALRKVNEQAGGEIAAALERMLPGLLTEQQKADYQAKIAADIRFDHV